MEALANKQYKEYIQKELVNAKEEFQKIKRENNEDFQKLYQQSQLESEAMFKLLNQVFHLFYIIIIGISPFLIGKRWVMEKIFAWME